MERDILTVSDFLKERIQIQQENNIDLKKMGLYLCRLPLYMSPLPYNILSTEFGKKRIIIRYYYEENGKLAKHINKTKEFENNFKLKIGNKKEEEKKEEDNYLCIEKLNLKGNISLIYNTGLFHIIKSEKSDNIDVIEDFKWTKMIFDKENKEKLPENRIFYVDSVLFYAEVAYKDYKENYEGYK